MKLAKWWGQSALLLLTVIFFSGLTASPYLPPREESPGAKLVRHFIGEGLQLGWRGGELNDHSDRKLNFVRVTSVTGSGDFLQVRYDWFQGVMAGGMQGRTFSGIWVQAGGSHGEFRLVFNQDCTAASGWWTDADDPNEVQHALFIK